MENDKPYIFGLGPIPEGAISNGQGGWHYPFTGTICEPIDFGKIAEDMYDKASPEEKVRFDKIRLFWDNFFKNFESPSDLIR